MGKINRRDSEGFTNDTSPKNPSSYQIVGLWVPLVNSSYNGVVEVCVRVGQCH